MKNILTFLEKYLPLAIAGVHAANTVPGATNGDKKSVVLSTITAVANGVAGASEDPQIQAVGAMIDVIATVVNTLTSKTQAVAPTA